MRGMATDGGSAGGGGVLIAAAVTGGLGDALKGLWYATVGTIGVIGNAIIFSSTSKSNVISKGTTVSKTTTIVPLLKDSDNPIIFPVNPNDFKPKGLVPKTRNGTKNGVIIQWFEPVLKYPIFEWDEDINMGSQYHIMPKDWQGKHGCPDEQSSHFYPGSIVPEPFATYYFK